MKKEYIISKGTVNEAMLATIGETVDLFKRVIKKHHPSKPTCNAEQYVKDVEFLLNLLKEKR